MLHKELTAIMQYEGRDKPMTYTSSSPADFQEPRPTNDEIKVSDTINPRSTFSDRQPSFYQYVVPNYQPIGDYYLLVTTFGTSNYYDRYINEMLPLMISSILGVIAVTSHCRPETPVIESD